MAGSAAPGRVLAGTEGTSAARTDFWRPSRATLHHAVVLHACPHLCRGRRAKSGNRVRPIAVARSLRIDIRAWPVFRVGPIRAPYASDLIVGSRTSQICGLMRSVLSWSLLSAARYALADATTMSVSAPSPLTIRPPRSRRTVTSPWDSVPVVIALTE